MVDNNVLQELTNVFGIEPHFDRHGAFELMGVRVVTTFTGSIGGLGAIRGMKSYGAYINEASLAKEQVFDEIKNRCSAPSARIICDTNPDNRIANEMPKYITNMRVGYTFDNPLRFQYNDESEQSDIDRDAINNDILQFNQRTNEAYHEKVMKKNLSVTGRAYELLYIKPEINDPYVMALDPSETFVVYDTSPEQNSLFGVHYYFVEDDEKTVWYVEVYTDNHIIRYEPNGYPNSELNFDNSNGNGLEEHNFRAVPITEFINNDERLGDWEGEMDNFDAYDKAISEMANSEEDFRHDRWNF